MPAFTSASNVRAYAGIDAINAQQDRWNDGPLASNIRAASQFLERRTGRQFELQLATTKTFTTNGEAFVSLPGLRSTSPTVSLSGSSLTAGTDAHLIPDDQQSGVYIGIQFRPFGRRWDYRSYPDWFDTNKDSWLWPGNFGGSDPNDLTITGDWGYINYPEELVHATNVMAAWITRRADSLLGGAQQSLDGTIIDMSQVPVEVKLFIDNWKLGSLVATGG